MKPCHAAPILAAALGLAACQGENKGEDQRTAVGEILPGSASDAMVPYDSLRSQPPLAPQTRSAGSDKDEADEAEDAPDPTATDGDTAQTPTESAPASTDPSTE